MDTNLILLIGPTIIALVMLIAPQWQIRRIEARMQAGNDSHLDEQRSYRAYPWQRNAKALRVTGAVILALEALYLGLSLLSP
jgi:hypothetical protein